jgi:hypothetical protein
MSQGNVSPDIAYELPREVQLMIDRAAEGLLDEQSELELRRTAPLAADAITAYDVAAASLFLATVSADASPALPRSLEQRLQLAGQAWCRQQRSAQNAAPLAFPQQTVQPTPSSPVPSQPLVLRGAGRDEPALSLRSEPSPSRLRVIPWLAAAAGVALAAFAWWSPARLPASSSAPGVVAASNTLPAPKDAYAQLASSPSSLKLPFGDWSDATVACEKPGVQGEVLWDEARKFGVMKFANLPKLDETKERYQLWIVDSRGMEQRISGGVFNGANGEQFVIIDPGISVDRAAAFAVTIERPDGVWVSDMKRRVVIAAAG